jgi:adenosylmethionine-8-amino-7-oxononanoate aminotransferase
MRQDGSSSQASRGAAVLYRDLKKAYPTIVRGEGIYLHARDGRRYLDAAGGAAVVTIGHGVGEVARAMAEQAGRVAYTYIAQFSNEPLERLAERLTDLAPPGISKAYFVSGGSEAAETALKLVRQYHLLRGKPGKYRIVSRWQAYHGNTIGALSMSGRTQWFRDFRPYVLDFPHIAPCYCYRCPFDLAYPACGVRCASDLERVIRQEGSDSIAAFVAEPIVGTSASALTPPAEYFRTIREICDRHDILFIADEVITGFGRTGKPFGIEHWGVVPDLMLVGKGISSGYAPLGGVLLHDRVVQVFRETGANPFLPFTFAGNPVSCAAGLAVCEYAERHGLFARAGAMGAELFRQLEAALGGSPLVGEIRGRGLLAGIELVADRETRAPFPPEAAVGRRVAAAALARGAVILAGQPGLVNGAAGDHLLLAPPYIIEPGQIATVVDILGSALAEVEQEVRAA